jgi:hypothetical protein
MERVMGIEPMSEAWEAPVLPLNYTRQEIAVAQRARPLLPPEYPYHPAGSKSCCPLSTGFG